MYEDLLKGKDGWIAKAVDVHGKDISRNKAQIKAPEPGKRLILSIDSTIQRIAEDALGKRQGSVVVLEPRKIEKCSTGKQKKSDDKPNKLLYVFIRDQPSLCIDTG
jgi:Cell division protein FtsI/penicillin-binding protein 2